MNTSVIPCLFFLLTQILITTAIPCSPIHANITTESTTVISTNDNVLSFENNLEVQEMDDGTLMLEVAVIFTALSDFQSVFTVDYMTMDGTATMTDNDYEATSGTLVFNPGVVRETLLITIHPDEKVEFDEMFSVRLFNVTGPAVIDIDEATITIQNDDFATLTVSDVSQAEGTGGATTDFIFDVTLDKEILDGFAVAYATNDITTSSDDLIANNGTLNFVGTEGETQQITVAVNQDNLAEDDEIFTVNLGAISNTIFSNFINASTAGTATINDDDTNVLSFEGDLQVQEMDDGTLMLEVAVIFTALEDFQSTYTVDYTTMDGTATTADSDYEAVSGTLTFAPGVLRETFVVNIHPDSKVELDENFTITLSNVSEPAVLDRDEATVTILNDDMATLTIEDVSLNEGSEGGTTDFTFTVTCDQEVPGGFEVDYTINDDIATSNDYMDNDGTLAFAGAAGETQQITVAIHYDNATEADETFGIALGNVSNTLLGSFIDASDSATGTIIDDDGRQLSFENDLQVQEMDDGTLMLEVAVVYSAFSGDPFVTVTVDYSTSDGTATTTDDDYEATTGTLTFSPGVSRQAFLVTVNPDSKVEFDEYFTITLSNINGPAGIDDEEATITILNDDLATLTIEDVSEIEGSTGGVTNFAFTVTLDQDIPGGFDVAYTTNDGTASSSDYTDNDSTLTFVGTAGETQQIIVAVNQDNTLEADETFTIALGDISNTSFASLINASDQATGTIIDDDSRQFSFELDNLQVEERDDGSLMLEVGVLYAAFFGPGNYTVTVDYATSDGTATTADDDYEATTGTLTFDPGNSRQVFTVPIHPDNKVEFNENFTVTLSNVNGPATIDDGEVTITILNDDIATLTMEDISLNEGSDGGTTDFTFTVTNDKEVPGGFDVTYTTSDGTANGNDYTENNGTLTFTGTAGENQQITVVVNEDNSVEDDETFILALGTVSNTIFDSFFDLNDQATGTIIDDDGTRFTFENNGQIIESDDGTRTLEVGVTFSAVSRPGTFTYTMDYTTSDGTATTADDDYEATSGTLTFGPGVSRQLFVVTINGDEKVEADETFQVLLSNITGPASIEDGEATVTIFNDDVATLTVEDVSQAEGTGVTATDFVFTVSLDKAVDGGFDVIYTTSEGTAIADDDYTTSQGTLNFAGNAGETQQITVPVDPDGAIETDETFTVSLGSISNTTLAASINATDGATGTIVNDDGIVAWTGAEDSDWYNPNNWSTGQIPVAGSIITIATSNNPTVLGSGSVSIGSLRLENEGRFKLSDGATLLLSDGENGLEVGGENCTINGTLQIENQTNSYGLSLNESLQINTTGSVILNGVGALLNANLTVAGSFSSEGSLVEGIRMSDDGDLTITESGICTINTSTQTGLYYDGGIVTVNGELTITNGQSDGIETAEVDLDIGTNGILTITGCQGDGINNDPDNRRSDNWGTMIIAENGGEAISGGSIRNYANATFRVDGTVSAEMDFQADSRLEPGTSPGCVAFTINDDINLSAATVAIEIEGTTACTEYDQLSFADELILTNAVLVLSGSYQPATGETFTIIALNGSTGATGTFANLSEGSIILFNEAILQITYQGGAGHDIVLTCLQGLNPPPNDDLIDAIIVDTDDFFDTVMSQQAIDASSETGELNCEYTRSWWYQITPTADTYYTILTEDPLGVSFSNDNDLSVGVYTGDSHPLTEVSCLNDDNTSGGGEEHTILLSSGQTYYIRIAVAADALPNNIITYIFPETVIWTGAENNNWGNPNNWNIGAVPNSTAVVRIPSTTNAAIVNSGFTSVGSVEVAGGDLTIASGSLLLIQNQDGGLAMSSNSRVVANGPLLINGQQNEGLKVSNGELIIAAGNQVSVHNSSVEVGDGKLEINGTLLIDGATANGLDLSGEGRVTIAAEGLLLITNATSNGINVGENGAFEQLGTTTISDCGNNGLSIPEGFSFTITTTGVVNINNSTSNGLFNEGAVQINGQLNITSTVENGLHHEGDGSVQIGATGTLSISEATEASLFMESGRTTTNAGLVSINTTSNIAMLGGTFTNATTGQLVANGTIGSSTNFAAGSELSPGNSPGCLIFAGNTDLGNTVLVIEIEGTDQCTSYDYVSSTSGLDITDATLSLSGNYTPVIGDEFTIVANILSGDLTGNFAGLTDGSTVNFNGVLLEASYETTGFQDQVVLRAISILPLDLTSFSGETHNGENQLTWTTANEENFSHFVVERSMSGHTWQAVDIIRGDESDKYQFAEATQTAYYRLKMVDLDGAFTYSKLIYLAADTKADLLRVFPNPNNGIFQVALADNEDNATEINNLTIINSQGQVIWAQSATFSISEAGQVDLSNLPIGIYLLQATTPNEVLYTQRIIIQ